MDKSFKKIPNYDYGIGNDGKIYSMEFRLIQSPVNDYVLLHKGTRWDSFHVKDLLAMAFFNVKLRKGYLEVKIKNEHDPVTLHNIELINFKDKKRYEIIEEEKKLINKVDEEREKLEKLINYQKKVIADQEKLITKQKESICQARLILTKENEKLKKIIGDNNNKYNESKKSLALYRKKNRNMLYS